MSETPSLWPTPPVFGPQMMIGAATPLWAYFTAAALTGTALWWMSRWPAMSAAPPAAAERSAETRSLPRLVVVEPVEEPILEAEFTPAPAPARPRKSKPVEVKPS